MTWSLGFSTADPGGEEVGQSMESGIQSLWVRVLVLVISRLTLLIYKMGRMTYMAVLKTK